MTFTDRLKQAQTNACFTVSDMALWFDVSRSRMHTWLNDDREPLDSAVPQLDPLLRVLEKTLSKTKRLPVPLVVRQWQRKKYIEGIKEYAVSRFSKAGSPPRG